MFGIGVEYLFKLIGCELAFEIIEILVILVELCWDFCRLISQKHDLKIALLYF